MNIFSLQRLALGNDVGIEWKIFCCEIEWLEQIIAKNETKKIGFFEHCQNKKSISSIYTL
jgi:hypothetical protein